MAKILVAEDDDNVRRFVVQALSIHGHEVTECEDGGYALEEMQAQDGAFDLLLSDIKMPVMDGIALTLDVGASFPDVTIVLMTGFADQRERAHNLNALVYDVLPKPFTLDQLMSMIDNALAGAEVELPSLAKQVVG